RSPGRGGRGVTRGPPLLLLLRRYHTRVSGSTTAGVLGPAPDQLPATGCQPGPPKANGAMSGAPAVAPLRRYQVMVVGSTAPTPARPAPAQSPVTGTQPGPPYWNTRVRGPAAAPSRRDQVMGTRAATAVPERA